MRRISQTNKDKPLYLHCGGSHHVIIKPAWSFWSTHSIAVILKQDFIRRFPAKCRHQHSPVSLLQVTTQCFEFGIDCSISSLVNANRISKFGQRASGEQMWVSITEWAITTEADNWQSNKEDEQCHGNFGSYIHLSVWRISSPPCPAVGSSKLPPFNMTWTRDTHFISPSVSSSTPWQIYCCVIPAWVGLHIHN